jgi:hypothetical protein
MEQLIEIFFSQHLFCTERQWDVKSILTTQIAEKEYSEGKKTQSFDYILTCLDHIYCVRQISTPIIQRTASCTIVDGASSENTIYKRVRILSVEGPGVGPAPAPVLAWKYLPSSAHAQKRTVKVPTGSAHLPEFTPFSAVCK